MQIGPFSFWTPLNSNGTPTAGFCVAALHWKNSITWSWALYWHPYGHNGVTARGFYCWGGLRSGRVGYNSPRLGIIYFAKQRPMWRRAARPS
jgi:hypothetical protein